MGSVTLKKKSKQNKTGILINTKRMLKRGRKVLFIVLHKHCRAPCSVSPSSFAPGVFSPPDYTFFPPCTGACPACPGQQKERQREMQKVVCDTS